MNDTPKLTTADLAQFTGTQTWFRHWFKRHVLYTEGVKFLAERGGAYWLIDEIALSQDIAAVARHPFQTWTLTVNADRSALLHCTNGNKRTVFTKGIDYTDLPLNTVELWFTGNVILLPSEY